MTPTRHGGDDGEHRSTHWAVCVDLIPQADEAHPEMIEFFERHQQLAHAACEAIKFPNQNAINLAVSGRRHQGTDRGAALDGGETEGGAEFRIANAPELEQSEVK
jgi:hypothetical protein